jgi:hypothetical protein
MLRPDRLSGLQHDTEENLITSTDALFIIKWLEENRNGILSGIEGTGYTKQVVVKALIPTHLRIVQSLRSFQNDGN